MEVIELAPGITLMRGNCLDALPIRCDAVITDPPYGMNWNVNSRRFTGGHNPEARGRKGRHDFCPVYGDNEAFDPSPWLDFPAVVLWGANHFSANLPVGTTLVWIKRLDPAFGTFLSDAELAWVKGGHGVYCRRDTTMMGETLNRLHPTQKPVGIMQWCMERAKVPEGATVLDPYMGSGTTGIACIRTGRKFIGIEIDEAHFESARRRLERELSQGKLALTG